MYTIKINLSLIIDVLIYIYFLFVFLSSMTFANKCSKLLGVKDETVFYNLCLQ